MASLIDRTVDQEQFNELKETVDELTKQLYSYVEHFVNYQDYLRERTFWQRINPFNRPQTFEDFQEMMKQKETEHEEGTN